MTKCKLCYFKDPVTKTSMENMLFLCPATNRARSGNSLENESELAKGRVPEKGSLRRGASVLYRFLADVQIVFLQGTVQTA